MLLIVWYVLELNHLGVLGEGTPALGCVCVKVLVLARGKLAHKYTLNVNSSAKNCRPSSRYKNTLSPLGQAGACLILRGCPGPQSLLWMLKASCFQWQETSFLFWPLCVDRHFLSELNCRTLEPEKTGDPLHFPLDSRDEGTEALFLHLWRKDLSKVA